MSTKLRLLKCYVWSTLLYGCEGWTVSQRMKLQLEADRNVVFTAYVAYCMKWQSVKWRSIQRANTSRNLLRVIVKRQLQFVGHIVRKSQLEAIALTGMIEGKKARGRQRKTHQYSVRVRQQLKICDQLGINLVVRRP